MYEVNHIANLANASVINKFHEMKIPGKIGPLAYSPNYPINSDPKNIWQLKTRRLDGALLVRRLSMGRIPDCGNELLEEQGIAPTIEPGDMDLLRSANQIS